MKGNGNKMKEMDLSQLLGKAEELRALFVLGQRVIPFIEEIFIFVSEIKPLLDEINISIKDNLKKMPNASKQLTKVTEATEMATIEIMDIVDGLFFKSDVISSNINKLTDINKNSVNNPSNVISLLSSAVDNAQDENLAKELTDKIADYKNNNESEFDATVGKTNDIINSIKDDSNSIMMALQMQDITTQQIAAVNNLLETVQIKLSQIIEKFQNSDIGDLVASGNLSGSNNESTQHASPTNVSKMHRAIAFDPDAVESITQKEFRQNNVDELINNFDPDATYAQEEATEVSSTDIDALFASNNGTAAEVENTPSNTESNDPISADDIDALFSGNSNQNDAPAQAAADDLTDFSQDDIDALFGK